MYTETFEDTAYKTSTTYNNNTEKMHGPTNFQWGVLCGTPNTGAHQGSKAFAMRYYKSVSKTPTLTQYFDVSNVDKITFWAKTESTNNKLSIEYSTNSGSTWSSLASSISITTNYAEYTYSFATQQTKVRLRFSMGNVTEKKSMFIDDIAFVKASASCTSITPSLSYAPSSLSVEGTVNPALTGNLGNGSVTYSSSNTSVATVNTSTGVVTAKAAGTATITATIAANNGYCEGTATANVTVTADPFTVTLVPGSGSVPSTTLTETSAGAGVTLTTPTLTGCDEWTFAGWKTTSAVTTETTTKPTLIAAGTYIPTANTTLYAVYQRTETTSGGGGGGSSTPITTDDIFENGGTYTAANGDVKAYITWTEANVVSIKQEQGSSTSAVNSSYVKDPRWYKSHNITITPTANIAYITVTAQSNDYATALANSTYTNATASANKSTVTITPTDGNDNITISMGAQARLYNLTVTYASGVGGSSSTTYYHSTPDCDPCASLQAPNVTATATANSITLSWEAVDGATSYNVYNYTTDEADETTDLTYTFNGLNPETEYEWEVESAKGECFKKTQGTTTTQKACTDAVNVIKGEPSNGSFKMVSGYQSTCNGTVTVTLSNIEPDAGYQFSEITQSGVNAAKVTIDNTAKTVTYAQNTSGTSTINVTFIEIPPTYTVTWIVNGEMITPTIDHMFTTNIISGNSITRLPPPPAAPAGCSGKVFVGWTTETIDSETDTPPQSYIRLAASSPLLLKM